MGGYHIRWPKDFDDYAWEAVSKGWLPSIDVEVDGRVVRPVCYDAARLSQDIEAEIAAHGYFAERGIVVLKRVDRENIEAAIEALHRSGELLQFPVGHDPHPTSD